MKVFADLHVHSRHSRATSKDLNIENLEKYARIKGIHLLGTGDFCHPQWQQELKEKLSDDAGTGIFRTKTGFPFVLQNELSFMYTDMGKGRRVHLLLLAKSLEVVEQITEELLKRGRVDYDGRPIFNMSCAEFTERMMQIDSKNEVIPAHAWTPWFGVYGSKSGYDSLKDCFKDQLRHIHAVETGLSSDPSMNWRLEELDDKAIISNSDAHSFWPWRIGREATIFDFKDAESFTYDDVISALRTKEQLAGTLEVDPGYGKYHVDGHRDCKFSCTPQESKKLNNICPRCRRPLTIGVLNRVEELATRPAGEKPSSAKPFYSMLPLSELIVGVQSGTPYTKNTWETYYRLVSPKDSKDRGGKVRTELGVLFDMPEDDIAERTSSALAKAVMLNRQAKLKIVPGYDGEYGYPVFDGIEGAAPRKERAQSKPDVPERLQEQKSLGEFF